ncbi:hypothetical protein DSECCO2_650510 [anaerobic digester metagenome]
MGYALVLGKVLVDMGVEEVERDAPHLHLPDRDVDRGVDQGNPDNKVPAIVIEHPEDRRGIAVQDLRDVLLPAVRLHMLVEVSLGVHEPDGDHRHTEVARCLDVVACEDAKPPRIERERVVQPELAGEVSDRQRHPPGIVLRKPARPRLHVLPEPEHDDIVAAEVLRVRCRPLEEPRRCLKQHPDGVVAAHLPLRPVEEFEENACGGVPAPPEVVCKVHQPEDPLRDVGEPVIGYLRLHRNGHCLSHLISASITRPAGQEPGHRRSSRSMLSRIFRSPTLCRRTCLRHTCRAHEKVL